MRHGLGVGQRITQTNEIGRQFRPELEKFAARRVLHRQHMGMQANFNDDLFVANHY